MKAYRRGENTKESLEPIIFDAVLGQGRAE
jgi:hypothetical protein